MDSWFPSRFFLAIFLWELGGFYLAPSATWWNGDFFTKKMLTNKCIINNSNNNNMYFNNAMTLSLLSHNRALFHNYFIVNPTHVVTILCSFCMFVIVKFDISAVNVERILTKQRILWCITEFTPEKSPTNALNVTKPSVSLDTWTSTSGFTLEKNLLSAQSVRNASPTHRAWGNICVLFTEVHTQI